MSSGIETDAVTREDQAWIERLNDNPSGRLLVQHMAATECVLRSGGQSCVEPPSEQAATWRRLICWDIKQNGYPFGAGATNSTLPKSMVMCNLNGNHAFYFASTHSLARVVCLFAQTAQKHVVNGIREVTNKAEELDASVIVCICAPFQYGIERVYWEIRTIRKTSKGALKDGELAFSSVDLVPRQVPCTSTSEHWTDELISEIHAAAVRLISPLCLDPRDEKEETDLSPDQMRRAIAILKIERRKLLEERRMEIDALKEEMEEERKAALEALVVSESKADKRVSGVVKAKEALIATLESERSSLNERITSAMSQVATLNASLQEALSKMAGMVLEHEHDTKTAAGRQSTLEAQVRSLQSANAKAIAEATRANKDLKSKMAIDEGKASRRIAQLEKQTSSLKAASSAVDASMKQLKETNAALRRSEHQNSMLGRTATGLLKLASHRHEDRMVEAREEISRMAEEKRVCEKDRDDAVNRLVETIEKAESERKDHASVVEQLTKKVSELEEEKKAPSTPAPAPAPAPPPPTPTPTPAPAASQPVPPKRGRRGGGQENGHPGNGAINGNQNTMSFVGQQPAHLQAFPQNQNYQVDHGLETMISQLHTALQSITASARASAANAKAAEMAQGKLDVLSRFGISDASVMHPQMVHHHHQPTIGHFCYPHQPAHPHHPHQMGNL